MFMKQTKTYLVTFSRLATLRSTPAETPQQHSDGRCPSQRYGSTPFIMFLAF